MQNLTGLGIISREVFKLKTTMGQKSTLGKCHSLTELQSDKSYYNSGCSVSEIKIISKNYTVVITGIVLPKHKIKL